MGTAVTFNIVPLFTSRGFTETDAAFLFTLFAVSLAVMHVVGGILADRVPLNLLLAAAMLGMVGTMLLIRGAASPAMIYPCGLLMGATQGLLTAVGSPLWARYYGRKHLGRIRGLLTTVGVASTAVGPFLMGGCRDLFGSYQPVLTLFALLPAPLVFLALLATRPRVP